MILKENNFAYIDVANLHNGVNSLGWALDYRRFRVWLKEKYGDGKPKGNCDADLVLQAACDAYENKCNHAILVSSDGDYAGLVKFLKTRGKFRVILSSHTRDKCSILLKRTNAPITYLNDVRAFLNANKKAPGADGTAQGSFS